MTNNNDKIKDIISNINQTKDIKEIIEQLKELKHTLSISSSNNNSDNNNENQILITSILKLLIENVLDSWYYAFTEFDKQLFESFFFLPNLLSESFITITNILSDYNNNNNSDNNDNNFSQKLNFLLNILYKFINNNHLSKLIIEFQNRKLNKKSNNNGSGSDINLEIHETVWNLIITSICIVPDKVRSIQYYYKTKRNRINMVSPLNSIKDYVLEFFTINSIYYSKIIQQCSNASLLVSSNFNENIIAILSNQLSILFTKMIKIGEKDIIVNNFFIELFNESTGNSGNGDKFKRKLQSQIVVGINGSCLDTFLESIIKSLPKQNTIFKSLFLDIYQNFKKSETSMIFYILINKILLLKTMDNNSQNCFLELLYSLLKLEKEIKENTNQVEDEPQQEGIYLLNTILSTLLKSWKDSYFIRNCTNEHHAYITRSIVFFIEKIGNVNLIELPIPVIENLKHLILGGIDVHLKFTISNINVRGMFVAEIFSKLFNNNIESDTPLKFNYSLSTPDQQCFSTNFEPEYICSDDTIVIANSDTSNTNTTSRTTTKKDKELDQVEHYKKLLEKEFKKYDDPDRIINDEDEEDEPRIKEINSDDEEGSDDDLKPYNLEDDESDLNTNLKKKIYLRDCLLEIQSQKHTAESWENALISISNIVWSNPDDLDEQSEQLATSLIHLINEYDIDNFSAIRHEALVSLAVQSTHIVIPYLTLAFGQSNFSIGQRIEILETIAESAKELSCLNGTTNSKLSDGGNSSGSDSNDNSLFKIDTAPSSNSSSSSSIINQIGIVRKWGIKKTPRPIIKSNRFHKYVKMYFYPLLERFDKVTQCFNGVGVGGGESSMGYDSYLLSRLIFTLGVIVECSGNSIDNRSISKELVKLLWSLKSHRDTNVQRSILYSFSRVFYNERVTKSIIDQDYSEEIEDIASFLYEISQSDSDKDSRVMAIATLSKIIDVTK